MFKKTYQTAKYTVKLLKVKAFLCRMLLPGGITPHIFQFIEAAIFRHHDVDYDINVID